MRRSRAVASLPPDLLPEPEYRLPERKPRRLITTFYSFKGGVGRSMALQGVAVALAERRQRVLMVDADIEAPGLTLAHLEDETSGRYGFVDLLGDVADLVLRGWQEVEGELDDVLNGLRAKVRQSLHVMPTPGGVTDEAPPTGLEARLIEVAEKTGIKLPPRGGVALFPVGAVLTDYPEAISRLELLSVFSPDAECRDARLLDAAGMADAKPGEYTMADVYTGIVRNILFTTRWPEEDVLFGHVFLDSRTGLADVANVCLRWLPDRRVVLSGLNEQNLRGTKHVMAQAAIDVNDTEQVTLVLSPVPNAEPTLLGERLERAREVLSLAVDPLLLHYEPCLALSDLPLTKPIHEQARLYGDYRALAGEMAEAAGIAAGLSLEDLVDAVANSAPTELATAERVAELALTDADVAPAAEALLAETDAIDRAGTGVVALARVLAAILPSRFEARGVLAEALADLGATELEGGDAEGAAAELREAEDHYGESAKWAPDCAATWAKWGRSLHKWAEALAERSPEEATLLYERAAENHAKAAQISPEEPHHWVRWGHVLSRQAHMVSEADAQQARDLWQQACAKYARAAQIQPADSEYWVHWGHGLFMLAEAYLDADAGRSVSLYEQASLKYGRATEIEPDGYYGWLGLAHALWSRAREAENRGSEEAHGLFAQACQACGRAALNGAGEHGAWSAWGGILSDRAQALRDREPDEALALYGRACEKYAIAAEAEPELAWVWFGWGSALSDSGRMLLDENTARAVALYAQADTKYARATDIEADDVTFWLWGWTLNSWAHVVLGDDPELALVLLRQASDRYAQALQLEPSCSECWAMWGRALLVQWRLSSAPNLLDEAREKLVRAEALGAVPAVYDLASIDALLGNADDAFARLERSLSEEAIEWDRMASDEDWDALREDERYLALKNRFGPPAEAEG